MDVDPQVLEWRPHPRVSWDVLLGPRDLRRALEQDVRHGLGRRPRELPPKYFYDAHGSRLFDRITRLPEYYPTRREREFLGARAVEIAARSAADTLVELGSGTSDKTRLLLRALEAGGTLRRFIPFDVDAVTLRGSALRIASEFPSLSVHAVVGDFERHVPCSREGGAGSSPSSAGPSETSRRPHEPGSSTTSPGSWARWTRSCSGPIW